MISRTKRMRHHWLVVLIAVVALLVAGCGSDDSDEGTDSDASAMEDFDGRDDSAGAFPASEETAESEGDGDEEALAPDAPSVAGAQVEQDQGRLLRREAFLSVEVAELEPATEAAIREVELVDGYLSNQRTTPDESDMTLRVPGEHFDDTLDEIAALGTLRERQVTTDDRTEVIVDLEARLETAEASLERTRSFFDEAVTVEELTLLEREVAQRESTVAALHAQLDNERSSVSLSTIRVVFVLEPGVEPVDVEPEEDQLPGILDALESGWNVLRTVGYSIALVVVWLLPWLPIIVVLAFALRWWLRRARAAREARSAERQAALEAREAARLANVPPPPGTPPPPAGAATPPPPEPAAGASEATSAASDESTAESSEESS